MGNKEQVIKGLECCTQHGSMCGRDCNGYYGWVDDSHTGIELLGEYRTKCPYGNCETGCVKTLAKDALALLKTQEPRVMTLEEVLHLKFDDVVFFEMSVVDVVISAIVIDVVEYMLDGEIGLIQFRHIQKPINNADLKYYGKTWRCWTSRPTDEERNEVKWK